MKVLTGPEWLFEMFNGIKNPKGTAMIQPARDAKNRPIIGHSVLNDPDWDYLTGTKLTDPNNPNDTRVIGDWLIEIDYESPPSELL
jgi:hypothetical protein